MAKPKKDLFADAFPRIKEKHPRSDFGKYAEITKKIGEMKRGKLKRTITRISKSSGLQRSAVARVVVKLEKYRYLDQVGRGQHGRRIVFLRVGDKGRTYWGQREKEKEIKKWLDTLMINIQGAKLTKKLERTLAILKRHYEKEEFQEAVGVYNTLVKHLDKNGKKGGLEYLHLNTKPLEQELTTSGELALEKIKEIEKEKERGIEKGKIEKGKTKAASAA